LLLLLTAAVWALGFSATGSGFFSSCFLFFLELLFSEACSGTDCFTGSETFVTTGSSLAFSVIVLVVVVSVRVSSFFFFPLAFLLDFS